MLEITGATKKKKPKSKKANGKKTNGKTNGKEHSDEKIRELSLAAATKEEKISKEQQRKEDEETLALFIDTFLPDDVVKKRRDDLDILARNAKSSRAKKKLVAWLYRISYPCIDCGLHDPFTIHFDHIEKGTKVDSVSHMITCKFYTVQDIVSEIDKCEMRCLNHHRVKTARENAWYLEGVRRHYYTEDQRDEWLSI